MTDERCVGCRETTRDRTRRAADERRIQRRIFLEHLAHLLGSDDEGFGALNGTRARAVRRIVEQESFAQRFTRAERHEPHGTPLNRFLDCHGASAKDGEKAARRALLEQHCIALVHVWCDEARQLVKGGLRESFEELRLTQLVAGCKRSGHEPAFSALT